MNESELGEAYEKAKREAEINRNIQKYTRLKEGSLDPENVKKYDNKLKEWKHRKKLIETDKNSGIINVIPNAENAKISIEKFTKYALNPLKEPNKAKAFSDALGYDIENADKLVQNIYRNIENFNAMDKGHNGYGQRYEILMTLEGENGKSANVKTGWIIDDKTNDTRLTSTYVSSKKIKE